MELQLDVIWDWILHRGWVVLLIIGIFFALMVFVHLIGRAIEHYLESQARLNDSRDEIIKRATTLTRVIRNFTIALFFLIGVIWILTEVGVDLGSIAVGAGALGVVIGIGAQKVINDFFNGFFILIENQFRVGDVIRFSPEISGLVEKVGFRTTVVRDFNGNVHTIPNGEITTVSNLTKGFSRYSIDVGVAYKENVDRVMEILREVGEELATGEPYGSEILEPVEVLGVQDLADSAVLIRVRFTSKPSRQWDISRELRRLIKNRFDAEGIEIPFPHRTIYYGAKDES